MSDMQTIIGRIQRGTANSLDTNIKADTKLTELARFIAIPEVKPDNIARIVTSATCKVKEYLDIVERNPQALQHIEGHVSAFTEAARHIYGKLQQYYQAEERFKDDPKKKDQFIKARQLIVEGDKREISGYGPQKNLRDFLESAISLGTACKKIVLDTNNSLETRNKARDLFREISKSYYMFAGDYFDNDGLGIKILHAIKMFNSVIEPLQGYNEKNLNIDHNTLSIESLNEREGYKTLVKELTPKNESAEETIKRLL